MTILLLFQQSGYCTFTGFYTQHVQVYRRAEFPHLVSYTRFVALMPPRVLLPLTVYRQTQLGTCTTGTGGSFVDSTARVVCHPARIHQHRAFRADARRGKTAVGWLYGFRLHLVVNDRGELLAFCLTPGNVDDRRAVPRLVRRLFGKLVGDRGSISQPLAEQLLVERGIHLITKLRKNMRNACSPSPIRSCCVSGPSSRVSTTNSRTSVRSSTSAIAVRSISSCTSSPVSSPTATNPRSRHLQLDRDFDLLAAG